MLDRDLTVYVFGCFGARGHYVYPRTAAVPRDLTIWLDTVEQAGPQVEGSACFRQSERLGITAIDWWDRQGDSRGGSHTSVFVLGLVDRNWLMAAAREQVPWAFRVDVTSEWVKAPRT